MTLKHTKYKKETNQVLCHSSEPLEEQTDCPLFLLCSHQAREAQDDLMKTKEELHMVMTAPAPPLPLPPPPPMYDHLDDNSDSEENASTHSADLQTEGINDHRNEEDRLTEAEKNERVQKQLKVRSDQRKLTPQMQIYCYIYFSLLKREKTFHYL